MRLVALLTDFGTEDIYVGVMKGVMRNIDPQAGFIDITHEIHPHSIREGALALRNAYRYFAAGTIFLVVVDPAVGSKRRPIALKSGGYYFVAPDNGVLSYVLAATGNFQAVVLENPRLRLPEISQTFHGRDIFAPAAAYLARGDIDLSTFGPAVTDLELLPAPILKVENRRISGEITHIDRFGNLITSVGLLRRADDTHLSLALGSEPVTFVAEKAVIMLNGQTVQGIRRAYHETQQGEILVQVDSNGYLEIAVNQASAEARLNASVGDTFEVILNDETA